MSMTIQLKWCALPNVLWHVKTFVTSTEVKKKCPGRGDTVSDHGPHFYPDLVPCPSARRRLTGVGTPSPQTLASDGLSSITSALLTPIKVRCWISATIRTSGLFFRDFFCFQCFF